MRLFWIVAALLALSTPSSAIFATLIGISPTLAKMVMFGLGTLGPTFFTTGLVYFLGRHFGTRELRPKLPELKKPGDRLDFAALEDAQNGAGYAYYHTPESQYAPQQEGQFAYVEGRNAPAAPAAAELTGETGLGVGAQAEFTHPRGRKVVSRS